MTCTSTSGKSPPVHDTAPLTVTPRNARHELSDVLFCEFSEIHWGNLVPPRLVNRPQTFSQWNASTFLFPFACSILSLLSLGGNFYFLQCFMSVHPFFCNSCFVNLFIAAVVSSSWQLCACHVNSFVILFIVCTFNM